MDMQMSDRVPAWLTPVAWAYIALALLTAAAIAYDVFARQRKHRSVAAELVWISSALYLGPFAIVPYARHGRAPRPAPGPQPVAVAGLPGGGASAVAHLVGVPLVIASGLTIAGIDLWVMIIVIGVLAMALLFAYERASHRPSTGHPTPLRTAAAAAVVTVLAFDIGMGGWMLLLHFNELMPPASDGAFWFLMQVGIVLGLVTGYPAVAWLAQRRQVVTPP